MKNLLQLELIIKGHCTFFVSFLAIKKIFHFTYKLVLKTTRLYYLPQKVPKKTKEKHAIVYGTLTSAKLN